MWSWTLVALCAVCAALAVASPVSQDSSASPVPPVSPAAPDPTDAAGATTTAQAELRLTTTTPYVTSANDIDSTRADLEAPAAAVKPVNELHPHAVLFGRTCGGSIISPTWVLTAGHCTLSMSGRYVLAGTNQSDNWTGVKKRVKRLVIHPRFSVGPYWLDADEYGLKQVAARFDFLLAELEEPLPLDGKTIAAIALDDQLKHPQGEKVGYAGYGAKHHGETMRHKMHNRELETVDDDSCRRFTEFDSQDMICTQGVAPRYDSACNGDSGSGLSDGKRLLGVASWVEDDASTCRPKAVVVFSRVAAVRDWIRQVTGV